MKTTYNYIRRPLLTVNDSQDMIDACKLMREHGVRHLVVLDSLGNLTGVVSERDVQRSISQKKISEFRFDQSISPEHKVSEFMSWPVITVPDNVSLRSIARNMLQQKISSVVIVNKFGDALGIVTTDDILAEFAGKEEEFCPKRSLTRKIQSFFSGTSYGTVFKENS